ATVSCAEAALFSLTPHDRSRLASGGPAQRLASQLLVDPERLLSAILFWNLLVNILFFSLTTIVGKRLREIPGWETGALAFGFGSLVILIVLGEMLPKSVGVVRPRRAATALAPPLALAVQAVSPIMPSLQLVNVISRRLFWPHLAPEPYLATSDMERAVEASTDDAQLLQQEHEILGNVFLLSEMRIEELMRPRNQVDVLPPSTTLASIAADPPIDGYAFMSEEHTDEIAGAFALHEAYDFPGERLAQLAFPVHYVPWCASAGDVAPMLLWQNMIAAVVVNEYGETMGVVTRDDLLDSLFSRQSSRTSRVLHRAPLTQADDGSWRASGMTSLRRLARQFRLEHVPERSFTVAGMMQETLERLPAVGDECRWQGLQFRVVDEPERGDLVVEIQAAPQENGAAP
ncbi:MAG: DUF21 domain-containing protein, partial [Planctomycetales bacterium]|nr:DUF21 domain-containing protein [Planctomycetales bacterium]